MDNELKPLWGNNNAAGKTLLDSRNTPAVGSTIVIDGRPVTIINTFINENKMFVSYRIGADIITKEYTQNIIYG